MFTFFNMNTNCCLRNHVELAFVCFNTAHHCRHKSDITELLKFIVNELLYNNA